MNTPRFSSNPEMEAAFAKSPVFSSIQTEINHEREVQKQKYPYIYVLNDSIVGQTTSPFPLTIEQGTDFKCLFMTGSAFSYDADVADATNFPIPNSLGVTAWAGRGLSADITDTRSGRKLTSGFVPFELLFSPGYGLNFQDPIPFKYFFNRNSKVLFDIRNRDVAARTHEFSIALIGFKIETP